MRRSISAILAVPTVVNGLMMMLSGPFWYMSVRGVSDTGPYNDHFVRDIGAAFVVAGLALAARAWRPRYWAAAVAGAAFLALHALLHLLMVIDGRDQHAVFDLITVVLPAGLALYFAFPAKGEVHA